MPESFSLNSLGNTVGAIYLGVLLDALLFGVTNVQAYMYFHSCERDRTTLKLLIVMLWILSALHTAFGAYSLWFDLITQFGNYFNLLHPLW
ncbi:hypothetical protein PUNSTDRAFT_75717 [Punctularia strigosozonata HHB-11173 SS5]|uniref:Uncharacterized protein n=1 Tax=Punctularia strigosozonata (strain HHB-11173) TaxID=741275 RepID=R7S3Q4_PUNST|nr:uncharacterized protein PUNSTDRAFT_75717 [Punctularia strigosozonata HHB-11173 SS5]EIN04833.1 hypothetical protein PUNSTDRAFT_75717 [Punctularia strigosozonata HHB-11173 SS5]